MNEPQTQGNIPQPVAQPAPAVAPAPALPENNEVRDRTREQFDKLLESNQRLFEANNQLREEMGRRNQPQAPAPIAPAPQQIDPREFVERDPVTGESYINETKMRARMQEIEERASRAEMTINSYIKSAETRELERQNNEAYSAYPELKPDSDKFDTNFNRQVRGVLTDSMFNASEYGGRQLSFKEAADLVRGYALPAQPTPAMENNVPGNESTANPGNSAKVQASAQVTSQPQNAPSMASSEELDFLRQQTRMGSDEALARRLVATDHTFKE